MANIDKACQRPHPSAETTPMNVQWAPPSHRRIMPPPVTARPVQADSAGSGRARRGTLRDESAHGSRRNAILPAFSPAVSPHLPPAHPASCAAPRRSPRRALLPARAGPLRTLFEAPVPDPRACYVPGGAMAGDADATAVETNPGPARPARDGQHRAGGQRLARRDGPGGARGRRSVMASPLVIRGLTIGRGPAVAAAAAARATQPTTTASCRWAAGLRLGRGLGFGLVWEHLFRSRYAGTGQPGRWAWAGSRPRSWPRGVAVRDVLRTRADRRRPAAAARVGQRDRGASLRHPPAGAGRRPARLLRGRRRHRAALPRTAGSRVGLFPALQPVRRRSRRPAARYWRRGRRWHPPAPPGDTGAALGLTVSLDRLVVHRPRASATGPERASGEPAAGAGRQPDGCSPSSTGSRRCSRSATSPG